MRILAFNWRDLRHPRAGGAEVYLHSVASEWVQRGHEVTIFAAAVDGAPAKEEMDGVTVLRRGSRVGVYREAKRHWQQAGRGSYDLVVDSVNTHPFMCPQYVRDVPVVAIIHQVAREVWFYESPLPVAVLGRYVLEPRWLSAYRHVPVVTVSQSSKLSLEGYGLERVSVVPEGWSPPVAPAVTKEDVPTLLFVGRLNASKRLSHALTAFQRVRRELPDAQMWVIGTGPREKRLRRRAGRGVSFLGRLSEMDKHERMARAHLLLATSVREGWGLVVTEAAAVGTATVGYDVPGLRDSITASNGILTRPDPRALADAVTKLFKDRALPEPRVGGVVPWRTVADRVLETAPFGRPNPREDPVLIDDPLPHEHLA